MLSNNDITNLQKNHSDFERIGKKADGGFWSKNGTVSQISNALDILGEFRNGKSGGDRLKALAKLLFAGMSGGK